MSTTTVPPGGPSGQSTSNQNQINTGFGPMTDSILNAIIDRLSSGNFKEKITEKIINPITDVVTNKLKPYIWVVLILYALILVLLIYIIFLSLR
jgi:hypothetical protein